MSTLVNVQVGPFIFREQIGMGGVAEVWKAVHVDDGRAYAVKILRADRLAEAQHLKALEMEFSILEQLRHPALAPGRRWVEVDGRPGFVMDLIPGENLATVLARKQPVPGLRCVHELAAAVAYVHENDLIHNDIKLENCVLRPDGSLGLIDFGSVKRVQWGGNITGLFRRPAQQIFGTATYLAPELIAGKRPTTKTDLYALGVAAFILITGRPPFAAATNEARLRANATEIPPTLASRVPGIPAAPASVIDRCLAKKPDIRPADAAEVRDAARDLLARLKPSAG